MTTSAAGPAPLSPQIRPGRQRGPWADLLLRLVRDKPLGAFGGAVFLIFLVCGMLAPLLAPYGANQTDLHHRLEAPSLIFPLGTDHLGRDVLSRILIGAQLSMVVALFAETISRGERPRQAGVGKNFT